MKWFYNMSIAAKLMTGFILVAVITGVVGFVGINSISTTNSAYSDLFVNFGSSQGIIGLVEANYEMSRVAVRDIILDKGSTSRDKYVNQLKDYDNKIDDELNNFKKTIKAEEEQKEFDALNSEMSRYIPMRDNIVKLALENKEDQALQIMRNNALPLANAIQASIEKLVASKQTLGDSKSDEVTISTGRTEKVLIVVVLIAIILAIGLGIFISKVISKPLKNTVYMINELKKGHLNTRLNITTNDEIGQLAIAMDGFADDLKLNVIDVMKNISKGNINMKVSAKDDKDEITPAIQATLKTINDLLKDTDILINSAVEGNLATRADTEKYDGGWKELVKGINKTLDAVIGPLNVSAEYIERISKGDIPSKITDNYNGDFNEIKNNINMLIDSLNLFVSEMQNMSRQHDLGDIDVVVDEAKFQGSYLLMAKGVNNMVNGHISVKKKAMACVAEFARGNFEAPLEKFPGKKAFINENLEGLRQNLKDVNSEINKLITASKEGKLSERANDKAFKGDWAAMIKGLNGLIDKIVEPVMEAATVLSEMSQGNLKVQVKGNYMGDHARIKEALNSTISTISGYINDISYILKQMADGNLDIETTGDYKGDFVEIKTALNNIIESFNEVMSNIGISADQVARGARQVSDGSQSLSQGSTEQASSIEELSSSIAEIAEQTKQNAVYANQANEISSSARDNAVIGNNQMKEMLGSMTEINEASSNISKIIKVIDEIAFQTNILALNAAVEAARAGQHGKGFAVVAEEVRNLAARSANAAKETTDLIEGSITKVEVGTRIANETAEALNKIVEDVEKTTNLVGQIASASNEQATGISQVNKGIEQVSTVVQTNSSTAEESAAASEELSSQSELLREMLGRFILKKEEVRNGRSEINVHLRDEEYKSKNNGKGKHKEIISEFKPKIEILDKQFGKY